MLKGSSGPVVDARLRRRHDVSLVHVSLPFFPHLLAALAPAGQPPARQLITQGLSSRDLDDDQPRFTPVIGVIGSKREKKGGKGEALVFRAYGVKISASAFSGMVK